MLDIHIAASFDDATISERLHGIPLEEHALLFGNLDLLREYPTILEMENYWADTHIPDNKIAILADEIKSLKSKLTRDSLKLRMLEKLEDACERAQDSRQSVFLLAD